MTDAQWKVLTKHFAEMNKREDVPGRAAPGACLPESAFAPHCSLLMSLGYMTIVCHKSLFEDSL